MLRNRSVLITGGAGFIGSNLVRKLLDMGNHVIVVDDFSRNRTGNLDSENPLLEIATGDVRDPNLMKSKATDVDLVIHTAARPQTASLTKPQEDLEVNAYGTMSVLLSMLDNDVDNIIYTSSSSVYGNAEAKPQSETDRLNPMSPYAVSKLAGENYCRMFSENYGLKVTILRLFNVYGPREKPLDACDGVVPIFLERILSGRPPLIRGDGKQTRDFTYIDDVVQATVLAAEHLNPCFEILNVGTGTETSINDLASELLVLCGEGETEPIHVPPSKPSAIGDVRRRCADNQRIFEKLGWKPKITLNSGLRIMIETYRKATVIESASH